MSTKIVPTEESVLKALTSWGPVNTLGGLARNVYMDAGGTWESGIIWTEHVHMAALSKILDALVAGGRAHEIDRADHVRLFGLTKGKTAATSYMLTTEWAKLSGVKDAAAAARMHASLTAQANQIVLARHADEVQAEIARLTRGPS